MNKEQQIEEIAEILKNSATESLKYFQREIKKMFQIGSKQLKRSDCEKSIHDIAAEALYNAGYRKIENVNGHNLPHEIDYLLTEFDEMGFAPTNVCDNPERKAKLWKSALVYEIELLLDEYAAIRKKAIEEFAKKLQKELPCRDYTFNGITYSMVLTSNIKYVIDKLLKEIER